MIEIISLARICQACPSQWEAVTTDGQEVDIRYRWGLLTVYLDGEEAYEKQIGGERDYFLGTQDMLKHTRIIFKGGPPEWA